MQTHIRQLQRSVADLFEEADRKSKSGDKAAAIKIYLDWLALNAQSPMAYAVLFNLGVMQSEAANLTDAENSFRTALTLKPDFLQAAFNLGSTLEKQQRFDDALTAWANLLAQPDELPADRLELLILALNNSGRLLETLKRYPQAEAALERSLRIDPAQPNVIHHWAHLRQKQCNWPVLAELPGLPAERSLQAVSALSMLDISDDPALQLAAAQRYVAEKALPDLEPLANPAGYGHRKLRIGYLSSDFSLHPVSMLTVELLELHDREQFEVYGFCWSPNDGSALRQRMIDALDVYVPIGALSDEEAARRIRAAEIDILVDLQGLTAGARINILARRPAPVQVAYLGFPGTSGMPFVDYVLCDRYVLPEAALAHFTERPLYLPEVFQVCDRQRPVGPTPTRASCGLPDDAFVFCAFNNNHKYTPELFAVWLDILEQVPEGVLWLLADNPSVQPNLLALCAERGIAAERLIFAPRALPPDYLARYRIADLFLDCFPFNGGTTANDALWMGLPLLTCSGRSFASRMAGSLLHSLGLDELVTDNFADYRRLAVELAHDRARLAALRARLAASRDSAALFDTPSQVRKIEQLLREAATLATPANQPEQDVPKNTTSSDAPKRAHHPTTKPSPQSEMNIMTKTFLHVGCGRLRKESTTRGFNDSSWRELRLDIDEAVRPDIVGTMTDMSRVPSASVDAIYSSHNIEHLYPHEVPLALAEFMRVLKSDGFAVITCPDLKSVCALVAEDRLTDPAYQSPAGPIAPIDILYGHRPELAMGNHYMAHRCGFTEKVLIGTLQAAGFASVISLARPASFDLWALASKSVRSDEELRALAAIHFVK
ncbi:tetratricopeptide repeat protein [Pseudomonas stutzeri]|nr:tetratricopeptide repeat protein [Stutzerimonas stutzeri]